MLAGRKVESIPAIDLSKFDSSRYAGIDKKKLQRVANFLNDLVESRRSPLYFFVTPDIERYAEAIGLEPRDVYSYLVHLVSLFPRVISKKAVFIAADDDLFYVLQEEDLEILKTEDCVYDPRNPKVRYPDPEIRFAFCMGLYR